MTQHFTDYQAEMAKAHACLQDAMEHLITARDTAMHGKMPAINGVKARLIKSLLGAWAETEIAKTDETKDRIGHICKYLEELANDLKGA